MDYIWKYIGWYINITKLKNNDKSLTTLNLNFNQIRDIGCQL